MSTSFQRGQILGRYELLLPLARGGMAEVWAARLHGTRGFQKLVAIKTMLPGVIEDKRAEQMFMDEAGLACRIQHPNVVEIIELGEDDGTLYLVMEWIEGEPLNVIIKRAGSAGSIPLSVAVNLMGQCCKGLQAAHELKDERGELLGVVHRDISPHNILVSYTGTVKIVDFGIAKVTSQNNSLTDAGEVKGKLAYMSPEHIAGKQVDRRSDVFALGIVFYQLSTGKHPFKGKTPGQTVQNTLVGRPTAPSTLVEGYPVEIERIVNKALHPEPEGRYSTTREFLLDLQRALPAALDHGADAETARFVVNLLGDRIQEKKRAIKSAMDLSQFDATGVSTQLTNTNQSGTMGAVTSDDAGSYEQISQLLKQNSAASRRQALIGGGVAVGVALALGITVTRLGDNTDGGTPRPAAAALDDRVPLPAAPYSLPTASVEPIAAASEELAELNSEPVPEVTVEETTEKVIPEPESASKNPVTEPKSVKRRRRRPKSVKVRSEKTMPAANAAGSTTSVSESDGSTMNTVGVSSPEKAAEKTDGDDRGRFGGRW